MIYKTGRIIIIMAVSTASIDPLKNGGHYKLKNPHSFWDNTKGTHTLTHIYA